jgi:(p)ppGpp synthase/HD superfamily hydrolase
MSTLENAIVLTAQKHAGQKDKSGKPYILHPLRVMLSMETEEERIVAILHDILEDTDVTVSDLLKRGFSEEVVEAIRSVTRRENESYMDFIRRANENEIGRKVKIADLKDNMNWDRIQQPTDDDLKRMQKYQKAYFQLKRGSVDDNS